ncbi:MAG: hypothetical protein KC561_20955, partial [Myxococcales bacterium]|nr:hypothetical protein [Myxococcales bacterium]
VTFGYPEEENGAGTCTEREEGRCHITTCSNGNGDPGESEVPPTAGRISISGGSRPLSVGPNEDGSYSPIINSEEPLFEQGDRVTVLAPGDIVPEFWTTLDAPGPVLISSPSLPRSPNSLQVNTNQPLRFEWSGGSGEVEVLLTTPSTSVVCQYESISESGTVPVSALRALSGTGTYRVRSVARRELVIEGWQIGVIAETPAITNAVEASGSASFQ